MAKSILQKEKRCLICHTTMNLHCHHVFEGWGVRQISEKYGLKVWLCALHHNASNESVHLNQTLNRKMKRWAQKKAMKHYGWNIDEFRERIGRNYIDEEDEHE